jgi:multicomponent Na+:H+ antiporter subunit B
MSDSGMSKIVKTMTAMILPLVLVFGLYVIAHGHLTPGGGFQGGAVVASGLVMILVAFGSKWTMDHIKEKQLSILESVGAISFIGIAFIGLFYTGNFFFKNFLWDSDLPLFNSQEIPHVFSDINTAGVIPLMNFAVGLKVIAGLFAIVLVMAYATRKKEEKA